MIIVNEALMALAQENVIIIDTMAVFKSAGQTWLDMVRKDSLHYTPFAYRLLSKEILAVSRENK